MSIQYGELAGETVVCAYCNTLISVVTMCVRIDHRYFCDHGHYEKWKHRVTHGDFSTYIKDLEKKEAVDGRGTGPGTGAQDGPHVG